jgi:septum formation protein
LLTAAGIDPRIKPSDVDEDAILAEAGELSVEESAQRLAEAKATFVAGQLADDDSRPLVIGCDSILQWRGQALGKPGTVEAATARLREMQATSGVLFTGHHVIDLASGRRAGRVCGTQVDFAPMSDEEIEAYVATGEPLNVAGSFTLDGLSSPFIAGIVGDPSNVIGLSMPLLRELCVEIDVSWLDIVSYGKRI